MCGAAPRLAAACCLCQLPLHQHKACRGSAGKHKQKIFTKFCCCFGGWGWCFDPHLQLHLSNCLCENIYHLPWTFPMCSVLVSADLRTLVPVHTRRTAARTLAAFLSYCGEQPTTLPPPSLPWQHQHHLAAHVATTRSSFARPGGAVWLVWAGPRRSSDSNTGSLHRPAASSQTLPQNWFCSIVNNREILQSFSLDIFCIPSSHYVNGPSAGYCNATKTLRKIQLYLTFLGIYLMFQNIISHF